MSYTFFINFFFYRRKMPNRGCVQFDEKFTFQPSYILTSSTTQSSTYFIMFMRTSPGVLYKWICCRKQYSDYNLLKKNKRFSIRHDHISKCSGQCLTSFRERSWDRASQFLAERILRLDMLTVSSGEYLLVFLGWRIYPLFSSVDRDYVSEETEETIDQVAILTSNVLFFVVMFIFAVFETYVFRHRV